MGNAFDYAGSHQMHKQIRTGKNYAQQYRKPNIYFYVKSQIIKTFHTGTTFACSNLYRSIIPHPELLQNRCDQSFL